MSTYGALGHCSLNPGNENMPHMHVWSRTRREEKQAHVNPEGRLTVQAHMRKRNFLSTLLTHSGMHELERAMRGATGCDKQLAPEPLRIPMTFVAAAMLGPRISKAFKAPHPS